MAAPPGLTCLLLAEWREFFDGGEASLAGATTKIVKFMLDKGTNIELAPLLHTYMLESLACLLPCSKCYKPGCVFGSSQQPCLLPYPFALCLLAGCCSTCSCPSLIYLAPAELGFGVKGAWMVAGNTALIFARHGEMGYTEIIKVLHDKGANIDFNLLRTR